MMKYQDRKIEYERKKRG